MIDNYNDFKKALKKMNNGTHSERQHYSKRLQDLRGADPDKYQEYTQKAQQEAKKEGMIKL